MLRNRRTLAVPAFVAALLLAVPADAQQRQRPARLGAFQDWTAATHQESGQKVCYAFTRASRSEGAPPNRSTVTLTVTHRPGGRDQVAVSVGYALARGAESVLAVGSQEFRSYGVVQTSAFFQDSDQLIPAFKAGREALTRTPGPGGRGNVTDTFSLSGFTAAYDAISRECPPQARPRR
ncbi:invasion associated locus B family protein [Roseomonas sp. AR75]|jgi:invasion protein IalB|uniref:invasion associated locus B family protein n=1 Tax=Roseomonas sp. AR75 TaxID=2562311 RepID=UPI0010C0F540|nr:invasion associated locus B family protein [Roseomonas sp. AR75]